MSTPHVTSDEILAALRTIQHPKLDKNIVDIGFIKDLATDKGAVSFTLSLTPSAASEQGRLKAQAEVAVMQVSGVASVDINVTAPAAAPAAAAGLPAKRPIPGVKQVIAVSSGKGGVGKSTVTVNLACALMQQGARVGILDADVYGPNIPLMLDVTGAPEGTNESIQPFERHGIQVMSMGLLVPEDQPMIWRGPMLNKAIQQFMFQVAWKDLDYLFVDMPPGTGDVQLTLTQNTDITGAVIVTTPQEVAVLDVKKAVRMFEKTSVRNLGVVENMSFFTPPGHSERYEIFGSGGGKRIEDEFGVPLLGQIPIGISVREGGDTGNPIVLAEPDGEIAQAFKAAAEKLTAEIAAAV